MLVLRVCLMVVRDLPFGFLVPANLPKTSPMQGARSSLLLHGGFEEAQARVKLVPLTIDLATSGSISGCTCELQRKL